MGATLAALVVAELIIRWFAPQVDPFDACRVNRFVPSYHEPDQRVVLRPNLEVLPGLTEESVFTVNEFGFRSRRLDAVEKPDGALRVFAIGGSTTECYYLDDDVTWPELLQQGLFGATSSAVDVVNCGHSGDTTREHLALVGQRLPAFSPDVVMMLVGINDLVLQHQPGYSQLRDGGRSWVDDEASRGWLHKFKCTLSAASHLVRGAVWTKRMWFSRDGRGNPIQDEYGRWIDSVRRARASLPVEVMDPALGPKPEYAANLRGLVALCRAMSASPVLITQPMMWGAPPGEWERLLWVTVGGRRYPHEQLWRLMEHYNDVVRAVAAETGATLVDLARLLPKDPDYFYDDDHFTIAGARAVAVIVRDALLEAGWPELPR